MFRAADLGDGGEFGLRDDGPGRIGRAGDDDAGRSGIERLQLGGGQLEPGLGTAGDLHRLQMQGAQAVAIGDIAGTGQGDAVARLEPDAERQDQGGRGAAGQQNVGGIDRYAVPVLVQTRDAGAQVRAFPIAHGVGVQHLMRAGDGGGGGAGRGLAELHMDDRPAFGLQLVRQAADGDGAEGFDGHGITYVLGVELASTRTKPSPCTKRPRSP